MSQFDLKPLIQCRADSLDKDPPEPSPFAFAICFRVRSIVLSEEESIQKISENLDKNELEHCGIILSVPVLSLFNKLEADLSFTNAPHSKQEK